MAPSSYYLFFYEGKTGTTLLGSYNYTESDGTTLQTALNGAGLSSLSNKNWFRKMGDGVEDEAVTLSTNVSRSGYDGNYYYTEPTPAPVTGKEYRAVKIMHNGNAYEFGGGGGGDASEICYVAVGGGGSGGRHYTYCGTNPLYFVGGGGGGGGVIQGTLNLNSFDYINICTGYTTEVSSSPCCGGCPGKSTYIDIYDKKGECKRKTAYYGGGGGGYYTTTACTCGANSGGNYKTACKNDNIMDLTFVNYGGGMGGGAVCPTCEYCNHGGCGGGAGPGGDGTNLVSGKGISLLNLLGLKKERGAGGGSTVKMGPGAGGTGILNSGDRFCSCCAGRGNAGMAAIYYPADCGYELKGGTYCLYNCGKKIHIIGNLVSQKIEKGKDTRPQVKFVMVGGGGGGSNGCYGNYDKYGGSGGGGGEVVVGYAAIDAGSSICISAIGTGGISGFRDSADTVGFLGGGRKGWKGGATYIKINGSEIYAEGGEGGRSNGGYGGDSGSRYKGGDECYYSSSNTYRAGGGGAGAGGAGGKAPSYSSGGKGGAGICGYGGGGGGGGYSTGGCGCDGGGNSVLNSCDATNCGGGGAGVTNCSVAGGKGGDGVVEICYLKDGSCGINSATGGTKIDCGTYWMHRFTSPGEFTVTS